MRQRAILVTAGPPGPRMEAETNGMFIESMNESRNQGFNLKCIIIPSQKLNVSLSLSLTGQS